MMWNLCQFSNGALDVVTEMCALQAGSQRVADEIDETYRPSLVLGTTGGEDGPETSGELDGRCCHDLVGRASTLGPVARQAHCGAEVVCEYIS